MQRQVTIHLLLFFLGIFSISQISASVPDSPWYLGLWVPEPETQETFDKIVIKSAAHPNVSVRIWNNGEALGPFEGTKGTSKGNGVIDFISCVFTGPDGAKYEIRFEVNSRDETHARMALTHHGAFGSNTEYFRFRRKEVGSIKVPRQPLPLGTAKKPTRTNPQLNKPIRTNPGATKPKPPVRVNPNTKIVKPIQAKPISPGSVVVKIENCENCSKYFISIYGNKFNESKKVSGNGVAFKSVPAGSYTIYVSYGGKTDAVVPVSPSQRKITVSAGKRAYVSFRHR